VSPLARRIAPPLEGGPYPSPDAAEAEMDALAAARPELASRVTIGRSRQGRPLRALRLAAESGAGGERVPAAGAAGRGAAGPGGGAAGADPRPALLVTAHIHACEYVGAYVARDLARRTVEGFGADPVATALLEGATLWVVPLLNPDGAARVWARRGLLGLAASRVTAAGVDPNRNFPAAALAGRRKWNSARGRPGSMWYVGPHPLSEPECRALARLVRREPFCAAVNFHSFGGLVYIPEPLGAEAERASRVLDVFRGSFQAHQRHLRYRPVAESPAAIAGQLDAFLLYGLGIPSVTVEVSRPGPHLLAPWNLVDFFQWANPPDPARWAANDAPAALAALLELLDRSEGRPCAPACPELAELP